MVEFVERFKRNGCHYFTRGSYVAGDSEALGDGIVELKIHYGPGYRVYYARKGKTVYLLLCGGNKSSQKKDIKLAKKYWKIYKTGGKDNG
ncbi:MAG: hypothetical protein COC15_02750 [Legionellales bacterium]|nr:MAG: hypothetical protein COC15_02750 [Legionellales bacterium]